MRIISKFHDYYDSAMALGHDASITFVRKTEEFKKEDKKTDHPLFAKLAGVLDKMPKELEARLRPIDFTFNALVVILAGKLYPCIEVRTRNWDFSLRDETTYLYSADEFDAYLQEKKFDVKQLEFSIYRVERELDRMRQFLALRGDASLQPVFAEQRVPLALLKRDYHHEVPELHLNPELKLLQFYKALDAWQAFQELDMFLSGIAAPEGRPTVEIEDKYRVEQHGFDAKSFRKAPTKRKKVA